MSKRISTARHRATPEKGATLEAVTHVLGRSGRQAAAIAAASGLVLTVAPAANAAPVQTDRQTSTLPATNFKLERTSGKTDVITTDSASLDLGRAEVESTAAPEPEPEPEVVENVAPVTSETAANQGSTAANAGTQTQSAATQQPQSAPASTASGSLGAVVSAAYSGIGSPYAWGGKTPAGWDCSGFTSWAYAQAGISIPSSTSAILGSGKFVRTSNPQPGDLVFQNGGSHVGVYVGNGQMIGAQNPSVGTILHSVTRNPLMGYYTYVG